MSDINNAKPYWDKVKNDYYFIPSVDKVSKKLSKIMITKKGLFILYGFSGIGKADVVNYTIDNLESSPYYSEKYILNVKINFFDNEKDFYYDLLLALSKEFKKLLDSYEGILSSMDPKLKNLNISDIVFQESKKCTYIDEIYESLENIKTNLERSVNEDKENNILSSNLNLRFFINNFIEIISLIQDLLHSLDIYDSKIIKKRKEKDKGYSSSIRLDNTYENIKDKILSTIQSLNNYFKINIIVDKIKKNAVVEFLDNNRSLYDDSTLIFILDIGTKLFVENNCQYTINIGYILLKSFSISDFLLMGKHSSYIFDDFILVLDKYFDSDLDIRRAGFNYDFDYGNNYVHPGLALFKFLNSEFYNDLSPMHQEIFARFYIELLNLILEVKSLAEDDYNCFEKEFVKKYDLNFLIVNILLKRFKDMLKDGRLYYKFDNLPCMDYDFKPKKINGNFDTFIKILKKSDRKFGENYYIRWEFNNFVINSNSSKDIQAYMNDQLEKNKIDLNSLISDLTSGFYKEDMAYDKTDIKYKFYELVDYNYFITIIDEFFSKVFYVLLHGEKDKNDKDVLYGSVILYNNKYSRFEVYYKAGYPGLNSSSFYKSQSCIDKVIKKYKLLSNTKKSSEIEKKIEYEDIFGEHENLYKLFAENGDISEDEKKQFLEIIIDDYNKKNKIY